MCQSTFKKSPASAFGGLASDTVRGPLCRGRTMDCVVMRETYSPYMAVGKQLEYPPGSICYPKRLEVWENLTLIDAY